jgi:hypothetical protein
MLFGLRIYFLSLFEKKMSNSKQLPPDVEPEEPRNREPGAPAVKGTSRRRSFKNLRREMVDEELSSPAVQRMLIDDIERLEDECEELRVCQQKFHDSDKRCGVLEEKFRSKISLEIMHVTCFLISGSVIGYAASNWTSQPVATLALILGGILAIAGVVAKMIKP